MKFTDYLNFQIQLRNEKKSLQAMSQHPFKNRKNIINIKKNIQALEEGAHSILTTMVMEFAVSLDTPDKNKYKDYRSQVAAAYRMYKSTSDYGSELFGGCVDMRVALIAGEGVSLSSENPKTQKYLDKFAQKNGLEGSRLIRMVETGELEGKNLLLLSPEKSTDKDKQYIKVLSVSWQKLKYEITTFPEDYETIKEISYKENEKKKTFPIDKAVYVRLGGCEADVNNTTNRLHRVLTDFENFSRAKYDSRHNTRLYGKTIPTWLTADSKEAKSLKKEIENTDFDIEKGFVGTAKMGLLEPSGSAADSISKDILLPLKCISTTTSIPVHWLAWPELMSNRATAENLMEVVNAGTKKERLIWEEKIHELIEKSMVMAIDEFGEDNGIQDEFTVKLPFVSLEMLKSIIEVYYPLYQDDIISLQTLRDTLPLGLNPIKEDKQIEKEKKKNMKRSPFNNNTVEETIGNMQKGNQQNQNMENKEQQENVIDNTT